MKHVRRVGGLSALLALGLLLLTAQVHADAKLDAFLVSVCSASGDKEGSKAFAVCVERYRRAQAAGDRARARDERAKATGADLSRARRLGAREICDAFGEKRGAERFSSCVEYQISEIARFEEGAEAAPEQRCIFLYGSKRGTDGFAQCLQAEHLAEQRRQQTERLSQEQRLQAEEQRRAFRDEMTDRMLFDFLNKP